MAGIRQRPARMWRSRSRCIFGIGFQRLRETGMNEEGQIVEGTAEYPWLANYDAGVPQSLAPYPHRTLLDYVADSARERPEHPAFLFKGRPFTLAELERTSDAFAAALASLGVKRGDRVAAMLPNCPQFFIAELAAWKLGG